MAFSFLRKNPGDFFDASNLVSRGNLLRIGVLESNTATTPGGVAKWPIGGNEPDALHGAAVRRSRSASRARHHREMGGFFSRTGDDADRKSAHGPDRRPMSG